MGQASKKDIVRLKQIEPLKQLYDSIVRTTSWFSMTVYDNIITNVYIGGVVNTEYAALFTDSSFIMDCERSGIKYDNILRVFSLMKTSECHEIGCVNWPDMGEYLIAIVYKLDMRRRKHHYMYAIGEQAKVNCKNNLVYKKLKDDIYKNIYRER